MSISGITKVLRPKYPPKAPRTIILNEDVKKALELGVRFTLEAEQDDYPLQGNALCSGDSDVDRKYEEKLIKRLDSGDIWAWASVKVTAIFGDFEGHDYLGGCSYKGEKDFKTSNGSCYDPETGEYTYGSYYTGMCSGALEDLQRNIQGAILEFETLKKITEI